MAEDFTVVVASWQPFYNLAGSAAFTLAGLVFVAVPLNIGKVALAGAQGDLGAIRTRNSCKLLGANAKSR